MALKLSLLVVHCADLDLPWTMSFKRPKLRTVLLLLSVSFHQGTLPNWGVFVGYLALCLFFHRFRNCSALSVASLELAMPIYCIFLVTRGFNWWALEPFFFDFFAWASFEINNEVRVFKQLLKHGSVSHLLSSLYVIVQLRFSLPSLLLLLFIFIFSSSGGFTSTSERGAQTSQKKQTLC